MFIFLKETRAKPHIGARKMDKKCKKSNDQATLVILGKQSGRGEKTYTTILVCFQVRFESKCDILVCQTCKL